jgi:hypothetical protein
MRSRLTPLSGLFGGVLLALLLTGMVAAYAGQVAATVTVSGPSGPQTCGIPITVSALIQETGGALIAGQPVKWSFSSGKVSGDQILDSSTTTNSKGVASTQVQFACSPHTVVIAAVADSANGTVVVVTSGKGLPRTDTAPASTLPLLVLAAIAVLIGSGTILRRLSLNGR